MYVTVLRCHYHYHHRPAPCPVGRKTICTLQYYDVMTTTDLVLVQWEGRHYVRYSITMSLPLPPQTCSWSSGNGDNMYVAVLRCHYHYNHITSRPVGSETICTLQYYYVITTITTDLLPVQWEGRQYVRYSITMSLSLPPQTCSSSSGK